MRQRRQYCLSKGIAVTGAGRDLDGARQPAIVERNGIRIGFLGYCRSFRKAARPRPARSGSRRCASKPSMRAAVRMPARV
ncbi:MAG: CapA family protein [Alphaproteobacteria bacterium]